VVKEEEEGRDRAQKVKFGMDKSLKIRPMMTPIVTRINGIFPSMTPCAMRAIIVPCGAGSWLDPNP
jgi:hypothetical protein